MSLNVTMQSKLGIQAPFDLTLFLIQCLHTDHLIDHKFIYRIIFDTVKTDNYYASGIQA